MNAWGRDAELQTVLDAVEQCVDGRGSMVLLTGEAGIGKSHLLREIDRAAAERGLRTAWGRAWEVGGAPAFWPWVEIYRTLGLRWQEVGSARDAEARFAHFERVANELAAMAAEGPLVLLFDDLHAADEPSLLLLLFAVRRLARNGVLFVAGAREREASELPTFKGLARDATCLALARLELEHVERWVGERDRAREIYDRSEGLPLFVEELLHLGTRNMRGLRARAVLDEHLSRLSDAARDVLSCGAVIGRSFDLDDLSREPTDVASAIQEALNAGVLVRSVDPLHGKERFKFAHVLLRDRLYDELQPSVRDRLHWRIGQTMVCRGELQQGAHQLILGARAGDAAEALDAALQAARDEQRRLAFESAAALARRGLALSVSPSEKAVALRVVLAETLMAAGDVRTGREEAARAHADAAGLGDAVGLARSALAYGKVFFTAQVDPKLVQMLKQAQDAGPPPELAPQLLARIAAAKVPPRTEEEADQAVREAGEALALARDAGDLAVLLETMRYAGPAFGYLVTDERRLEIANEQFTVAAALDRADVVAECAGITFATRAQFGRTDATEPLLALERAVGRLASHHRWRLDAALGTQALFLGRLDEAEARADAIANGPRREGDAGAGLALLMLRIAIARFRGEPAAAAEHVDPDQILRPPFSLFRPWLLAATGRIDEACGILRSRYDGPPSFPQLIVEGDATVLTGNRELAESARERLAPFIGLNELFFGPGGTFCVGPTSCVVADLDRLLGNEERAQTGHRRALTHVERANFLPLIELVRARLALAPTYEVRDRTRPALALTREGELWSLTADGKTLGKLGNVKGMGYLAQLLDRPGVEIHVLELVGTPSSAGDAGPLLDEAAIAAYRRRAQELRAELQEAESWSDLGRAERARGELSRRGRPTGAQRAPWPVSRSRPRSSSSGSAHPRRARRTCVRRSSGGFSMAGRWMTRSERGSAAPSPPLAAVNSPIGPTRRKARSRSSSCSTSSHDTCIATPRTPIRATRSPRRRRWPRSSAGTSIIGGR